jgi:hypothetical protein
MDNALGKTGRSPGDRAPAVASCTDAQTHVGNGGLVAEPARSAAASAPRASATTAFPEARDRGTTCPVRIAVMIANWGAAS